MARLRALAPGILVSPLETGADPVTQAFIDAKSDIKVMEARLAGLVGVFSRAAPYLDSDLAPAVLCDNSYDSWLDGLGRAHRLCLRPEPPPPFPPRRAAEQLGPLPWAEALFRVRLERPLSVREVTDAVRFVRDCQDALLLSPELFDEEDYLGRHADVRDAVAAGVVASGYRHYVQSGHREGRAVRRRADTRGAVDAWWARLLQTVGRLEAEVAGRAAEIEALRDRLALRRLLPNRPAPIAVAPAPPQPDPAIRWHPDETVQAPCPVCDAAGPQPVLLRAEGETLLRCRKCGSCFYERRIPHEYERDAGAATLRQLYLEQNAGIYHQTRPLFAIEGVDSLLDVGCGFGYPVHLAAAALGWRAVGIDPSPMAAEGASLLDADIRNAISDIPEPISASRSASCSHPRWSSTCPIPTRSSPCCGAGSRRAALSC